MTAYVWVESGRTPHHGDDCVDVVGGSRRLGDSIGTFRTAAFAAVDELPALFVFREAHWTHQPKTPAFAIAWESVIDMF